MTGRIREAIELHLPHRMVSPPVYGPPADAAALAAAEQALGGRLPSLLRELYEEFDGLWFGDPESSPRQFIDPVHAPFQDDEGNDPYFVLPLRYLPAARALLIESYGRAARDRLVAAFGPREEEGYNDFEGHLGRCVAFSLVEAGASFRFLTDLGAWGVGPGRVGKWDHDGGPWDGIGPLVEFLAETCAWRSQL